MWGNNYECNQVVFCLCFSFRYKQAAEGRAWAQIVLQRFCLTLDTIYSLGAILNRILHIEYIDPIGCLDYYSCPDSVLENTAGFSSDIERGKTE